MPAPVLQLSTSGNLNSIGTTATLQTGRKPVIPGNVFESCWLAFRPATTDRHIRAAALATRLSATTPVSRLLDCPVARYARDSITIRHRRTIPAGQGHPSATREQVFHKLHPHHILHLFHRRFQCSARPANGVHRGSATTSQFHLYWYSLHSPGR